MTSSFLISACIIPQSYLLSSNNNNKTFVLLLFLLLMEAKNLPLFKQGVYVINLAENWERVLESRTLILSLEQWYS